MSKKSLILVSFMLYLATFAFISPAVVEAADIDVYLLFSSSDKKMKNNIADALPDDINVKEFNVDSLALADYSGKQKAAAKINNAKATVFIGDAPSKLLSDQTFKLPVDVHQSTLRKITVKNNPLINVISAGTDVNEKKLSVVTVSSKSEVGELDPGNVDVVKVETSDGFSLADAQSALVQNHLGS
ncbi:MAG: hypothetical protein ABEK50_12745 [bacterium]